MKICYKADGTSARGEKIIKALESNGGKNQFEFKADDPDGYYFIGENNHIRCEANPPKDFFVMLEPLTQVEYLKSLLSEMLDTFALKKQYYPLGQQLRLISEVKKVIQA